MSADGPSVPTPAPLAASFAVHLDQQGHVQIQAPLHDVPLCLELLAAGQRTLARYIAEHKAQPEPPRPQLYMPDGSLAPPAGN